MTILNQPHAHWLLDEDLFPEYRDELIAEVRKAGHMATLMRSLKPGYGWEDEGCSYRQTAPEGACVLVHADIALATRIKLEALWHPGAYCSTEKYFCSRYYADLGPYLINSDYVMLPFAELSRCADFLFETLGDQGRIFVRPDSPLKIFTGQVITQGTLLKDLDYLAFYEFPHHELVVISSPKNIIREWRFVVVEGTVVTGCQYMKNGERSTSRDVAADALSCAQRVGSGSFQPDDVWTVDIGETSDGRIGLLEIGAFSFAELYACEMSVVARSVSDAAVRNWERSQ